MGPNWLVLTRGVFATSGVHIRCQNMASIFGVNTRSQRSALLLQKPKCPATLAQDWQCNFHEKNQSDSFPGFHLAKRIKHLTNRVIKSNIKRSYEISSSQSHTLVISNCANSSKYVQVLRFLRSIAKDCSLLPIHTEPCQPLPNLGNPGACVLILANPCQSLAIHPFQYLPAVACFRFAKPCQRVALLAISCKALSVIAKLSRKNHDNHCQSLTALANICYCSKSLPVFAITCQSMAIIAKPW